MIILFALVGAFWGTVLGQREGAHAGTGLGYYGLVAGAILGAAIGTGVWFLAERSIGFAVAAVAFLGIATVVVRARW